ncbi:cytochrome P450 [Romeria aff. gracilis LEGE 07310]|uniref:Cytochrome P450 n=1 Tax=Vasconcelosia minhoensis LEGE 07310 TaxID=915328 RepID=A0A8J7A5E6_9CYAN|nr:cytochrome P450 [Romeria gracilis]MBE9076742.1 cytochrome P450 [Romeria aff. gracilis LEGE 07310]
MTLPPRPKTPQTIRMVNALFRPAETLESYQRRYGDLVTLGAPGNRPLVLCSHPDHIQTIFSRPQDFDSGASNRMLSILVGDHSLLLMDGDRHRRQRQLLMPPFHGERMRAYGQLIGQITKQVIEQWPCDRAFPIRSSTQSITLQVILQAVFGVADSERYEQLQQLLSALLESTSDPVSAGVFFFPMLRKDWGAWSPWGRFLRLKRQVKRLIYAEIQERRESDRGGDDILSLLISARDAEGQPMTDPELHDELMTLLVAGHETTASALAWALYWTAALPAVQQRLQQELRDRPNPDELSGLSQLPYLNAVCKETLRIYPIAMFAFARIAKVPLQLGDYPIDPGTWLAPCIYQTHQRPDLYPNPKQFRPERFLERQFSPYEYIPFGGSDRVCIGLAFAQYEMKLALATILSRFHLTPAQKPPVRPVRRGLTLAPPKNLKLIATPLPG